ncbi:MAG: 23S rRNA (guanosine(2251)-2'-O)-methyltransferase RlmB [Alphaproteobacteria bacterium]
MAKKTASKNPHFAKKEHKQHVTLQKQQEKTSGRHHRRKAEPTPPNLTLHPYLQELKNNKKLDMLYGLHAVEAALKNPAREIEAIIINPNAQGKVKELYEKLAQNTPHDFDLIEMERPYFDLLAGGDAVHQSIIMFSQPLPIWEVEDLYEKPHAMVMMLDQPSDPRNIGAILRSCAAFGADALIVTDKNTPESTPLMAKAAVGAMEYIPIIRVTNLKNAVDKLKDNGFWFIGLDGHTETAIDDIEPAEKSVIIMGSEGDGLRRLTKESCDFLVKIPMEKQMESLNMSVAASIALYELRKKIQKP